MKVGRIVNFVTPDKVGKLLHYFTLMGLCDEEPVVIVFKEDPSKVRKLHHSSFSFVWFISEHDIPREQIQTIISISDYLDGKFGNGYFLDEEVRRE